jgi:hypothetical protein
MAASANKLLPAEALNFDRVTRRILRFQIAVPNRRPAWLEGPLDGVRVGRSPTRNYGVRQRRRAPSSECRFAPASLEGLASAASSPRSLECKLEGPVEWT